MIKDIRTLSQQLSNPDFDNPKDLVSWMGAIQAQDYNMSKWAVGVRLKSATINQVEKALESGQILRTHVMRPTWHLVAAEDIRWMLKLSKERIKSANNSFSKDLGITESLYSKCERLMHKMLEGNKSLTKQEITSEFAKAKISVDTPRHTSHLIMRAEAEGTICSGVDKNKKPTYALLEERVPSVGELHKEEALAKLALAYFKSHSPASLQDFVWWSGLSITESKQAIGLISSELVTDKFESHNLYVHQSYNKKVKPDDVLHLLPSYDEYLISYKDRTTVMDAQHHSKAFNNFGIFQPVIMYRGEIVGNWRKSVKKGQINIETSFFEQPPVDSQLIKQAEEKYKAFIS